MPHFSESEWRRAMASVKRSQRREMILFFGYMLALGAVMVDLWTRGPDSLFGRAFIWLATR